MFPRIFLLAIAILPAGCDGNSHTASPPTQTMPAADSETVRFSGEVVSVVYIQEFAGGVTVVDIDPKFVVTVEVVGPSVPPSLAPGEQMRFAIHSPSMTFGMPAEETVGKRFDMRLVRGSGERLPRLEVDLEGADASLVPLDVGLSFTQPGE